ncbi:hypothetical protein L202_03673 [Cryptococcus amylolentus CBS 6039]|uniref:SURP motif domain-containing protein n=1 Tax=Cryptococcus amylolentus CBS 6039 TaxID=1295533 RepID=A0A1E3HTX9_9TREE|nr:hypothetical protein L202_03673 [Cryptococcus amylolentus CBS 6039]ODN79762.1 hypothetical protein L202_03673 [Cryptococcus amylolentus CBS 6039]
MQSGVMRSMMWTDLHDMIHLLPSLPSEGRNLSLKASSPTRSSSSWSLPSDTEETWALSDEEEMEIYKNEKKKKWMEGLRAERLREREREDMDRGKAVQKSADGWDDDEEPPEAILTLMAHTALALSGSPNPSVLEIRILTNHSNDERFAFLRGRYRKAWEAAKGKVKREKEEKARKEERERGLGGLGGYGSGSESESEGTPEPPHDEPPPPPEDDPLPPLPPANDDEEEKKRQRRLRAEEWKRKRAEAKG